MIYMGNGFHIDDYQGVTFASKSVGISTSGSNSSPHQEMFAVTNQDLTSKNEDFNVMDLFTNKCRYFRPQSWRSLRY
jgi:hypothetical protein